MKLTVGIDFGTSTSEIAYIDGGKPVLIPNHLGEFITPSVVYINENGSATVGREAKDRAIVEPENTFLEVKRLLGQNKALTARGKKFTPVDIASMVIKYLAGCAKAHLGEMPEEAVITVPAYFNDTQRREVVAAGEKAGLTVKRIINEPTAASLDYGINHLRDCNYILVYDLGGGTLDVTVLELFEGVVDVKASCGNNALGGKDFDSAIMDFITESVKKKDAVDLTKDLRAMIRVKNAAEECKIALSLAGEFEIQLPFLYEKNGEPSGFSKKITRRVFEDMIKDNVYSTASQIKSALFDAELSPEEIDLVLLVGGSTRIPLVTRFLNESFGFSPKALVDPDLAVVRGAAVQAGVLSGLLDANAVVLTDVCPYSLSTDVLVDEYYRELVCDILINRNTTLPASVSKAYATSADDQQSVIISAYQGEGRYPKDNYLLNKFYLTGIPKARAHKEKVLVTFTYDLNGILTVSCQIVSTGKSATVTVDTSAVAGYDLSEWKTTPDAKTYRRDINKADRLIKLGGPEATEELSLAVNEMKKGLVLGWDALVLESILRELKDAIRDYGEEE